MLYRHFPTHYQVFKVQNVPWYSGNIPFTSHLPENLGFRNVIQSSTKPLKMLYRHFKCLKCKMFLDILGMFHLPPIYPKIWGFKMWSNFFQNNSKCFIDTSLHIIKSLSCKMFHNFLGIFHLPPIYPKIWGFEMWSNLLQNHSKCFIDTSLHIIKCLKYKMFLDILGMLHLPQNLGFQIVIQFFPKQLKMLYRHFPTHNQVFKLQNVP
jgi:hypothetical protein